MHFISTVSETHCLDVVLRMDTIDFITHFTRLIMYEKIVPFSTKRCVHNLAKNVKWALFLLRYSVSPYANRALHPCFQVYSNDIRGLNAKLHETKVK